MTLQSSISVVVVAVLVALGWKQLTVVKELHNTVLSEHVDETLELISHDIRDRDDCLQRFRNALRIPSVSDAGGDVFGQLSRQLKVDFPKVFKGLNVETFNEHSMMMTWKGSDASLDPVVLISHLDVVPATSLGSWTHEPFAGDVADGYVWGRGALDTKFTAISILEAVNQLLMKGVRPARTLIVALGHDEEVGGELGAHAIAQRLEQLGVKPALVLDEGGFVAMGDLSVGSLTLAHGPFAMVATAEKTAMNWKVDILGKGGHASLPDTASGKMVSSRLSKTIATMENNPMPTKLEAPTTDLLKAIGEVTSFWPLKWLLRLVDHPIINPIFGQILGSPAAKTLATLVRSTCGIVSIKAGGDADNVLPQHGMININVRTLPGDSREFVREYLEVITKGLEGDVEITDASSTIYPESTVTSSDSVQFHMVKKVIQEVLSHRIEDSRSHRNPQEGKHGQRVVAMPVFPMLLTGMTDSRWYHTVAPHRVVRFSPFAMNLTRGDLSMIHGIDEKVGVHEYFDAIRFFWQIIQRSCVDADQSWSSRDST